MASVKANEEENGNVEVYALEEEMKTDQTSYAPEGSSAGDEEIEALKKKLRDMEEEDAKLRRMQDDLENSNDVGSLNKDEMDSRSIFVGNVDYSTTPEELQQHFHSCGTINRVTIVCDKWTGHPKGYAYIEFADKDAVSNSVLLNETLFKGRQLKVIAKRTNVPGLNRRGRYHRGIPPRGYYRPYYMPRGRFRSRRAVFHPYS